MYLFILEWEGFNCLAHEHRYQHRVLYPTPKKRDQDQFSREVRGEETTRRRCEKEERRSIEITDGGKEKVHKFRIAKMEY